MAGFGGAANADHKVGGMTDGISSIAWSPTADHLVAGTWDNKVMWWDVQRNASQQLMAQPRAESVGHTGPVLDVSFTGDGQSVVSASADHTVMLWNIAQAGAQAQVVGKHAAPVKCARMVPEMGLIVSGSWDKTVMYWDTRQQVPVMTVQLPERCYAMDVRHPLLLVATAATANKEKHILQYDLTRPQAPVNQFLSPLKHMTRCIAAFPDRSGFAIGSVEGRVGIHHLDAHAQGKNFAFKCHRTDPKAHGKKFIFPVNTICFHPFGTFSTAGADGAFSFWDKENKQRLKQFPAKEAPISASAFNAQGSIFAYAVGYDWSRGVDGVPNPPVNYIGLQSVDQKDVTPRAPVAQGRGRGRR